MSTPTPPDNSITLTMGGLRSFGTHYDSWTGGKLNSDWIALDASNPDANNPNQLRAYTVKAQSAFNAR